MRRRLRLYDKTVCAYVLVNGNKAHRLAVIGGRDDFFYVFEDNQSILDYEKFRRDYKKPHINGVLQYSERVYSMLDGERYIGFANEIQRVKAELLRPIDRWYSVRDAVRFASYSLFSDVEFNVLLSEFHRELDVASCRVHVSPVGSPFYKKKLQGGK